MPLGFLAALFLQVMANRIIPKYISATENPLLISQPDIEIYQQLVSVLANLNDSRPIQTIKQRYSKLVDWIMQKTPMLKDTESFSVDLQTRCRWILSGRSDFPVCRFCGKKFGFTRNLQVRYDYSEWCSNKCRQTDPIVVARTKATKFKNHGDENYCNADKIAQTFLKKYGVSNPNKLKAVRDKIEQTNIERYGFKHTLQAPNVQQKIKQANLTKFGTKSPLANKDVREKGKITSIAKYGVEFPSQSDVIKQRAKSSFMKRYGVDNNMKSVIGLESWKKAFKEKHGVDSPFKDPAIRKTMHRKYMFAGMRFDSAPELALYIWLKDHNIEFEFQPNISFMYMHAGKEHLYFPDFKIGMTYVEIKGDQFFKPNGEMTSPYSSNMSVEQYDEICGRFEAKRQCMLKNNVKILRKAEYSKYISYVRRKYGASYLRSFRVEKPSQVGLQSRASDVKSNYGI